MRFNLFYNSPAWYKFILAVLILLIFSLVSFFIGILSGIPFFHLTAVDVRNILLTDGVQTQNISFLKYLQVIQSVGTFFFPALFLAWLFAGNSFAYLRINTPLKFYSLLLVSFSILFAIPIINFTGYLNSLITLPDSLGGVENKIRELEQEASELMKSFLDVPSTGGYLINLMVIAVLPAICEEFLFRGIFQRLFIEWTRNKHIGIIIAAIMFSFFHLQFMGFIPRFLLGVYFGYLLIWSNTLWLPIAAHFINNSFAVTFYHYANQKPGLSWIDEIGGADGNMVYLFSGIFLFAITVILIYYNEHVRSSTHNYMS
jgi:membrane protease YdiL (CAAX protease family)